MPTYDYRCERCETQFEIWQSMADDSLTVCPASDGPTACVAPGEGPVRKVFSSVGISFKGDGFYKNDHGANARSRTSESTSDSGSGDSESKGSDTSSSSTKDSKSKESTTSTSKSTPGSSGKRESAST